MEVLGYFWNRNYDYKPPENPFDKWHDDIFPNIFAHLNAQSLRFCITCKRFTKFLKNDKTLQIYQAAMTFLKSYGRSYDRYNDAFLHFDPHLALKKARTDSEPMVVYTEIAMNFKTFDKPKALEIANSLIDNLEKDPYFSVQQLHIKRIPTIRNLLEICPDKTLKLLEKWADSSNVVDIMIALFPSHAEKAQNIFDNCLKNSLSSPIENIYAGMAASNPKNAFAEIKKLDQKAQDNAIKQILEYAPLYPYNPKNYKEIESGISSKFSSNCTWADCWALAEFHWPYDQEKALSYLQKAIAQGKRTSCGCRYSIGPFLKQLNPLPKEIAEEIWKFIELNNYTFLLYDILPRDPLRGMLYLIVNKYFTNKNFTKGFDARCYVLFRLAAELAGIKYLDYGRLG